MEDDSDLGKLVAAWSIAQNAEDGSAEFEANAWAVDEFYELPFTNPEKAWEAIMLVLSSDPSHEVLLMTGVGPLESLLNEVGCAEQFVERTEQLAKSDRKFKRMLRSVWLSSDNPLLERLEKAGATIPGSIEDL